MMKNHSLLHVGYDDAADVLHLYLEPHIPYHAVEENGGLVWRYRQDSGEPLGVTVDDFREYWAHHRELLESRLAEFFHMSRAEAAKVLPE
jgi:hypothetical protein